MIDTAGTQEEVSAEDDVNIDFEGTLVLYLASLLTLLINCFLCLYNAKAAEKFQLLKIQFFMGLEYDPSVFLFCSCYY